MKCEILKHDDVESFAFRIICCASQSEKERERERVSVHLTCVLYNNTHICK